jgi:hypothetical protein
MQKRRKDIASKLRKIEFPKSKETIYCHNIGASLQVTAPTIKNYISGKITDGYLAEAILEECIRLKLIKNK